MIAATVALRVIVTGIVAIVPSAKTPDLTRLIAPNAMMITPGTPNIPEHFAYVEIPLKNVASYSGRSIDFRYHHPNDPDGEDRAVFVLRGEEVRFGITPSPKKLKDNDVKPDDLTKPQTLDEKQSTVYELQMARHCTTCGPIDKDYFDVAHHPDKVAARLDLMGGSKRVNEPKTTEVWKLGGGDQQPLAQEVFWDFSVDTTNGRQTILFTRYPDNHQSSITLKGKRIQMYFGNAPLRDIMRLDREFPAKYHTDDHFAVIYRAFTNVPANPPVLELVKPHQVAISGPDDNCVPPGTPAQDPR
jgi:hypothetical protein